MVSLLPCKQAFPVRISDSSTINFREAGCIGLLISSRTLARVEATIGHPMGVYPGAVDGQGRAPWGYGETGITIEWHSVISGSTPDSSTNFGVLAQWLERSDSTGGRHRVQDSTRVSDSISTFGCYERKLKWVGGSSMSLVRVRFPNAPLHKRRFMMAEKLFSAKCWIHGSQPCEVFCDNLRSQKVKKRCSKKRRQIAKNEIEEGMEDYYEDLEEINEAA